MFAYAESLYAITKHAHTTNNPSIVKTYAINEDQIAQYPDGQGLVDSSSFGYGPVAITVSDTLQLIFIFV